MVVIQSLADVTRDDAGDWSVEIKNEAGTAHLNFKAAVKGQ